MQCTDFTKRRGSPFHNKATEDESTGRVRADTFETTPHIEKHKQIQSDLLERVNKKSAEIASSKPSASDGVFTEVITHGAFTAPKTVEKDLRKSPQKSPPPATIPKSLLGFPSSANTLALDAKADLESDHGISQEVKEKVISKLFTLATMVQHVYESKVRLAADFERFKEKYFRDELRREKEQSEQLYKINMSFQSEVVQMIQQLKMDIDTRGTLKNDHEDLNGNQNDKEDCQTTEISDMEDKDSDEQITKTAMSKLQSRWKIKMLQSRK